MRRPRGDFSGADRSAEGDPYSRVDYRRMIAWPARIEREWPLLERHLGSAPERSVVDLGCGTGEHARFLAANRFHAVGVDGSKAQIERAREGEYTHPPFGPRFVEGDLAELDSLVRKRFGAALCLGNTLAHLEDDRLARTLAALQRRLLPEAVLLLQMLNYERILGRGIRHLPLDFRHAAEGGEGGEVVFLRLMTPDGDRHVRFCPTTLALHVGVDPPVELVSARELRLRAWRRPELEELLRRHGFEVRELFGDMIGGAYDAAESADLVIVAARA